jgi:hypothetical protein
VDEVAIDLKRYPIRSRLTTHPDYDRETLPGSQDGCGEFMAGYNREDGRIYLAVVVHDDDLVLKNGNPLTTDAVEIYVEGLGEGRAVPEPDPIAWGQNHSAKVMPVIQYVGLPGDGLVYATPKTDGAALMYGRIEDSTTEMKYRRAGGVIVYEWALQAYDRYPERPTRLDPGKRLGLDVAIVDRDRNRPRPHFTTWAPEQTRFKGFDAGQLGELILDDGS